MTQEGQRQWTHLDTFSGIGGFALAAAWTGRIQTVQFVEIDPFCRRVLAKHWPEVDIHDDIRTFMGNSPSTRCTEGIRGTGGEVWHDAWGAQSERRGLDLLTGGFPCQPFSAAGKRKSSADDRYLWPELARVIRCARPRWCLLENVPGIIGLADGLDRVLADLGALGYATGTVVIPAAAVGAYHRRDRVWIVAHAEGTDRNGAIANGHAGGWGGLAVSGDVADAAPRGLRRGGAPRGTELAAQCGEDAADGGNIGLQGQQSGGAATRTTERSRGGTETLSRLGGSSDGLPRRLDGPLTFGPGWESGIPRVTQHEADRVNKLKTLGNSIVPQVAYELLMMMLAVDEGGTQ